MKSWVRKDILPFPATYVTHEKACITSYYCSVMAKPICLQSFPTGERAYQGHWQLVLDDKVVKESMMGFQPTPWQFGKSCRFLCKCRHIHTRTYTCTCTLTLSLTHTHVHTHAHTHSFTRTRTHIHASTRTCTWHVPMHACTHTLVVSGLMMRLHSHGQQQVKTNHRLQLHCAYFPQVLSCRSTSYEFVFRTMANEPDLTNSS